VRRRRDRGHRGKPRLSVVLCPFATGRPGRTGSHAIEDVGPVTSDAGGQIVGASCSSVDRLRGCDDITSLSRVLICAVISEWMGHFSPFLSSPRRPLLDDGVDIGGVVAKTARASHDGPSHRVFRPPATRSRGLFFSPSELDTCRASVRAQTLLYPSLNGKAASARLGRYNGVRNAQGIAPVCSITPPAGVVGSSTSPGIRPTGPMIWSKLSLDDRDTNWR
jgi:hypothetical protein